MKPYEHTDEDGDVMTIADLDGKPGTALVRARHGSAVTAKDLPVITGKLYEACGLPSPVILDRPDISIPADGDPLRCEDLTLRMHEGGISMGLPGITAAAVSPDALRRRAAFMAAYADAAEAEPDPAEVEELAKAIRADRATHDALPLPPAIDKLSAHAALRWMNAKAAQDA